MRKNFAYISLFVLTVLTSCSNETETEANLGAVPAPVQIENSDVEIRLSSGAELETRGSVESDENRLFEVEGLGIFCMARGYINDDYQDSYPIKWDPEDNSYSVWMNNVKSNAVKNEAGTETLIRWADDDAFYWYPTGSVHSYKFYGYYPYSENVSFENEVLSVTYALDGTQDVIYAHEPEITSSLDKEMYSASYFRNHEDAEAPTLAFDHKFMRLTFQIKAGKDAEGLSVSRLVLKNVPAEATLKIARRTNEGINGEGTVTSDWTNTTDYTLMGAGDTELTPVAVPAEGVAALGQGFLLPVPDGGSNKLPISVTLQKDGVELRGTLDGLIESGRFYAGNSYNVVLTINGPREIEIKATLAPWNLIDQEIGVEL